MPKSKEQLLKDLKNGKAVDLGEFLAAKFEHPTVKPKYRKFKKRI